MLNLRGTRASICSGSIRATGQDARRSGTESIHTPNHVDCPGAEPSRLTGHGPRAIQTRAKNRQWAAALFAGPTRLPSRQQREDRWRVFALVSQPIPNNRDRRAAISQSHSCPSLRAKQLSQKGRRPLALPATHRFAATDGGARCLVSDIVTGFPPALTRHVILEIFSA
jgi:hypothetical protein